LSSLKWKCEREDRRGKLLLRWVVGKINTLGNVAFQSFNCGLEELLLGIVDVRERVNGFLGSGFLFYC